MDYDRPSRSSRKRSSSGAVGATVVGATALLVALLILLVRPQSYGAPGTPAPGTRVISVPTMFAAPTATTAPPAPTATAALPPTRVSEAPTAEPTEVTAVLTGTANVAGLEVRTLESFPVQIQVVAKGMLPNPCTAIERAVQERDGPTFRVTLTTAQPLDKACIQQLVPFEHVISLDVAGLKAGTYTVQVNGGSTTFTLAVDNVAP